MNIGASNKVEIFEEELNSFDPADRREALETLTSTAGMRTPEGSDVNMHFHSFFSFNAEGWSPSRIAWESKKAGLVAAGLCDFDVIDGLDEFLEAGRRLGLRTTVNLETRAFFKEYAAVDINSPGEPGVTYIMAAGFARELPEDSPQARGLDGYRERARTRNVALIERINPKLPAIAVDYEADVLPLTPTGSATERHIITAYVNKSREVYQHPEATARFWAGILGRTYEEAVLLLVDTPALEELVRAKLVKKGGVGYEQPSASTFPTVDEFIPWVRSCEAIPMMTWLDGTSAGEKDGRAMLECLQAKGAAAINIIPDRNWNIANPEQKKTKVAKLNEIVQIADSLEVPINIGTEMNKLGLPFADRLDGEVLAPHKPSFLRGARIMVGHTLLLRYAGMSYIGPRAAAEFPALKERNRFFESVGRLPPLTESTARQLESMGPEKAYGWLRDQGR